MNIKSRYSQKLILTAPRQFLVNIDLSLFILPDIKYSYARFLFFGHQNQTEIEHRFE
jgi:hypothetical protein